MALALGVVEAVLLVVLAVDAVLLAGEVVLDAVVAIGDGSDPTDWESQVWTPGTLAALLPAYLETNCATSRASCPTTTFCGMIAPEKPPFSIAYSARVTGRSHRWSKLGPLVISAVRMFDADPFVAAYESV